MKQNGITLIALVITIIVILILAGVSISSLTGENGVLTKTSAARIKNEIASVQEKANFAYADINTDNIANKLDKTTAEMMEYVANNLNEEGYTTVLDMSEGNVTGISISEENIYLVPTNEDGDKTKDIIVSLVTEGDNLNPTYLVTISNEQYRMSFTDGEIKISDEPIKADEENKSYTLTITPTNIVTNGSVLLAVNGENITSEKEIDITNKVTFTVSSTETQINTISNVVSLALKNNLNAQIGNIKNVKVAVEKIYDFTITSLNRSAIGFTDTTTDLVIPETFVGDGNNGTVTGRKYRIISIGNAAFMNCTALKNVEIMDGLEFIGSSAFWGCSSLITIKLPNTLKKLSTPGCGGTTFADCKSLKEITIPKSLEYMYSNIFQNAATEIINYEGTIAEWKNINRSFWSVCLYTDFVIHCIDGDLDKNEYYTDGEWKYYDNTKKQVIKYTGNSKNVVIPNGVNIVGGGTKVPTSTCTSVSIPEGVTKIENRAFDGYTKLSQINLPDSLIEIGNWAFGDAWALESIDLPDNIKYIGQSAFYRCGLYSAQTIKVSYKRRLFTNLLDLETALIENHVEFTSTVNSTSNYSFGGVAFSK